MDPLMRKRLELTTIGIAFIILFAAMVLAWQPPGWLLVTVGIIAAAAYFGLWLIIRAEFFTAQTYARITDWQHDVGDEYLAKLAEMRKAEPVLSTVNRHHLKRALSKLTSTQEGEASENHIYHVQRDHWMGAVKLARSELSFCLVLVLLPAVLTLVAISEPSWTAFASVAEYSWWLVALLVIGLPLAFKAGLPWYTSYVMLTNRGVRQLNVPSPLVVALRLGSIVSKRVPYSRIIEADISYGRLGPSLNYGYVGFDTAADGSDAEFSHIGPVARADRLVDMINSLVDKTADENRQSAGSALPNEDLPAGLVAVIGKAIADYGERNTNTAPMPIIGPEPEPSSSTNAEQ